MQQNRRNLTDYFREELIIFYTVKKNRQIATFYSKIGHHHRYLTNFQEFFFAIFTLEKKVKSQNS